MRASDVANVRDRRAAELRRSGHSPTRHDKLALAVRRRAERSAPSDQGRCPETAAGCPFDHAARGTIADRGLAFGQAVQVAHGADAYRAWAPRPQDSFLSCSQRRGALQSPMPRDDKLTPADPPVLAEAIAFALSYRGKKRVHQADEYMAQIAAERNVTLERARFVVMRKPLGGHSGSGVWRKLPRHGSIRERSGNK